MLGLGLWLYLGRVGIDIVVVGLVALLSPEKENDCEDDGTEDDNAADYSTYNAADWGALLLLVAIGIGAS